MEDIRDLFENGSNKATFFTYENLKPIIVSILIIVLAFVLWKIFKRIISKYFGKRDDRKAKTASNVIGSTLKYLLIVLCVLTVLDVNGVNITSLVTGLGIVGIVVGLAVQDFLQDIVMGLHILGDDFFTVGDVIKVNDMEGVVTRFTVRTTKIKDIATGDIVSICNRDIKKASIVSDELYINLPLSYDADPKLVRDVLTEFAKKLQAEDNITGAKFMGTNEFGDSAINYLIQINCPAQTKRAIRRKALGMAQDELAAHGLEIPFNQLDVHLDKN